MCVRAFVCVWSILEHYDHSIESHRSHLEGGRGGRVPLAGRGGDVTLWGGSGAVEGVHSFDIQQMSSALHKRCGGGGVTLALRKRCFPVFRLGRRFIFRLFFFGFFRFFFSQRGALTQAGRQADRQARTQDARARAHTHTHTHLHTNR